MKKLVVLLLSVVGLSACATSSQFCTSDGKQRYSIDCSGAALNWGTCYQKADDICGTKGYVVLVQTGAGDQGAMVAGTQYGIYGGSLPIRTMIIKCKE